MYILTWYGVERMGSEGLLAIVSLPEHPATQRASQQPASTEGEREKEREGKIERIHVCMHTLGVQTGRSRALT